jgi:hypothetical protein
MKEQSTEPGPILFVEEGGQLRLLEKSVEQLTEERTEEPAARVDATQSFFDELRVRIR